MQNHYERILKENMAAAFLPIIERELGIRLAKVSDLPGKLQRTAEREPDFVKLVEDAGGRRFILHLEFQTVDDSGMIFRMQTYHALLSEKYRIPVEQVVFYLGRRPSAMRSRLQEEEIMRGFNLLQLREMNFEDFLRSELPEGAVFAILADFGEREVEESIRMILARLTRTDPESLRTQRLLQQLLVLARISKLEEEVIKIANDMPIVIDIENDRLYNEGKRKGLAEGKQKGLVEGKQKGLVEGKEKGLVLGEQKASRRTVLRMLDSGRFSMEEISIATGLSMEEITIIARKKS